jgi:hypothetical protein
VAVTWLGIDVGTTNTKVCLLPQGRIVTIPTGGTAGDLQRDTLALIEGITDGHQIEGIGIAGMAETGAPLDRDLRPLTPLITWRDQPGTHQAKGVSSAWYVDGAHGCAISGNGAAGGLIEQRLAYFGRDYPWLVETLDQIGPPSNQLIAPYPQGRQAPRRTRPRCTTWTRRPTIPQRRCGHWWMR